jgi:HSP20 family protein
MSLLNSLLPSLSRTPAAADRSQDPGFTYTVKPAYEIKETPEAWGVTVYLPGVARDGLEVTAEEGEVRIVGRRAWTPPEGWASLHRETAGAPYQLVLTHDDALDADKIGAELRDGVLTVTLAKKEAVKPRKIAVN